VVRTLKKLQDNLGDFNDLVLQQRALSGFAHELTTGETPSERTLIALGRLVERLAAEQARIQRKFRERFERFATRENQRRVRKLFAGDEKRS
jgi:CHAD domain-containing protein